MRRAPAALRRAECGNPRTATNKQSTLARRAGGRARGVCVLSVGLQVGWGFGRVGGGRGPLVSVRVRSAREGRQSRRLMNAREANVAPSPVVDGKSSAETRPPPPPSRSTLRAQAQLVIKSRGTRIALAGAIRSEDCTGASMNPPPPRARTHQVAPTLKRCGGCRGARTGSPRRACNGTYAISMCVWKPQEYDCRTMMKNAARECRITLVKKSATQTRS